MHQLRIYSPNPLSQAINIVRFRSLVRKLNPDIVHLFGLFSVSSLGALWAVKAWPNLVASVWGSDIVPTGKEETAKERAIKRHILAKARQITATSQYLADKTERYLVKGRRVRVIRWGVDTDFYTPGTRHDGPRKVVVGFAKRLHTLSGPDLLLKAFSEAQHRCGTEFLLRVAGVGPMAEELRKEAQTLGIEQSVEWVGWLRSSEHLREFYRSLDIFVMPSRREAYGMAALEASAAGVPVVASRLGGIPEIVVDNVSGILVRPDHIEGFANAIQTLAMNPGLRSSMGAHARARAEREFSWNASLQEMVRLYCELAEAH